MLPVALALVAATSPAATSAEAPQLVVLRFTSSEGIEKALLEAATASAETAALRVVSGRLKVVTRDMLAAVVGEQTLLRCEQQARCELDLGVGLGTGYLLAGSIRKVARRFEMTAKLYDVRKLELLQQDNETAAREDELLDRVEPLVQRVLRSGLAIGVQHGGGPKMGAFDDPSFVRLAPGLETFIVEFATTPPGATVRLDGALLCSATPCSKRVTAGAHLAVFEKERYTAATAKFVSGKGARVTGALAPTFGWLSVETVPVAVRVAIDGNEAGTSPVRDLEVDPGPIEVAVSDPCWSRTGERIVVTAADRRTITLRPRPRVAGLRVDTEDLVGNAVDAAVRVDGVTVGTAGAQLEVPVCSREVEVTVGNETLRQRLSLVEGKVTNLLLKPSARTPEQAARPAEPAAIREPRGAALKDALYGVGLAVANNLEVFSLTAAELETVLKGIRSAMGTKPRYPYDAEMETAVNDFARSRAPKSAERVAAREKKVGAEYLAKMSKEKGAKKTASGAIVISEKEGTGATPTAADKVKVNYTGTLVSGRVFDASARHGGPAEFPLNGVIKCWTEALQLVKVGGKAKVVCPSEIAYGPNGNPSIPGNAVLTFEVELLDIVK
jgi:FKBP-type peptidyl-prolyl cis-trans isomerase/TolB-like protein